MAAGPNKSVERLKRVLASLTAPAKAAIKAELWNSARSIADVMRLEAARGATGNLQASVRVEQGRKEFSVVIRAGGPLTTKNGYDYSLANEFGTIKATEQPFFWNSYNANKKRAKNNVRKAGKKAIEEQARRDGLIVS
jgi:HK97 gp10 family phage protein